MITDVDVKSVKARSQGQSGQYTRKLVYGAVLAALAVVLALAYPIPIFPAAPFLLYEPGDVPIILAALLLGLGCGLSVTVVAAVVMAVVSGQGGWIGVIMHIIATGTLITVISASVRRLPFKGRYIIASIAGTLAMAGVMALWNLILTPIYMGVPRASVASMIMPVIVPFNLIKAGVNSFLAYLVASVIKRDIDLGI